MSETQSEYSVVLCTCPADNTGQIAEDLVKSHLAACVNIIDNIRSVYRWKGDITKDNESLLIIKTQTVLFNVLSDKLQSMHPYDVPEIIQLPIKQGNKNYLNWILENTKS